MYFKEEQRQALYKKTLSDANLFEEEYKLRTSIQQIEVNELRSSL